MIASNDFYLGPTRLCFYMLTRHMLCKERIDKTMEKPVDENHGKSMKTGKFDGNHGAIR